MHFFPFYLQCWHFQNLSKIHIHRIIGGFYSKTEVPLNQKYSHQNMDGTKSSMITECSAQYNTQQWEHMNSYCFLRLFVVLHLHNSTPKMCIKIRLLKRLMSHEAETAIEEITRGRCQTFHFLLAFPLPAMNGCHYSQQSWESYLWWFVY